VSLARITPFLAASTTVEQSTAVHTAVAERVRMELETISLTLRVQSDAGARTTPRKEDILAGGSISCQETRGTTSVVRAAELRKGTARRGRLRAAAG
jgi:hypothetical protein